jgi:hypothetical protein
MSWQYFVRVGSDGREKGRNKVQISSPTENPIRSKEDSKENFEKRKGQKPGCYSCSLTTSKKSITKIGFDISWDPSRMRTLCLAIQI